MRNSLLPLLIIILSFLSCSENEPALLGHYNVEFLDLKNVTSGTMDIIGEPGDLFGKIEIHSKRKRVYEIGFDYELNDTLYFYLPGDGGYLKLNKSDSGLSGSFKYFGLQSTLKATKISEPSEDLLQLSKLKPIGPKQIFTNEEESFPSYDTANDILYFTRGSGLYFSKFHKNQWNTPELLPIARSYNNSAPYVFNNGNSILFTSNKPLDSVQNNKKNLWITTKKNNTWSTPYPLPYPINIDSLGDYHGAITSKGTIYFVSYNRDGGFGRSDIYQANKVSEKHFEVMNLGNIINSELSEADIFIDPDEKYLLFASTDRAESYGADDIYISFNKNGVWQTPKNVGPKVNSYAYEYGAWVDAVNGYLYFNSYRRGSSDIYRIALSELEIFNEID